MPTFHWIGDPSKCMTKAVKKVYPLLRKELIVENGEWHCEIGYFETEREPGCDWGKRVYCLGCPAGEYNFQCPTSGMENPSRRTGSPPQILVGLT
jgi:hypothetical protein